MRPRGEAPAKLFATVHRCILVGTVMLGLGVAAALLVGSLVVPELHGLKEMGTALYPPGQYMYRTRQPCMRTFP